MAERKNLLSMLFLLLALAAYGWYAETASVPGGTCWLPFLFVLGLMAQAAGDYPALRSAALGLLAAGEGR